MRSPSRRGSCTGWLGKGLAPLFALSVLATTPGCRDDAGLPTEPVPMTPHANVSAATALSFHQVSAGTIHTCGVTTDYRAYCWGLSGYGQLGDGTTTSPRLTPVAVLGGLRFRHVSAQGATTCGVTTDNRAYCWGLPWRP
jgi:hypothetical protein